MLNKLFDMENPFFRFLARVADLMILNIIFLLTCIPIVTIGAAWTALYYMTLKMVRNEESYIIRGYLKSFKENFRQATIMWLIVLVFGVLLYLDFRIVAFSEGSGLTFMRVSLTMVAVIGCMLMMYVFPVLAKFYNNIRTTFLNAFLMSIRHLPQTIVMMGISVGAVLLTFLNDMTFMNGILAWIMVGFAAVAFCNSWFLVRIFDKYIPPEAEETDSSNGEIVSEAAGADFPSGAIASEAAEADFPSGAIANEAAEAEEK